MADSVSSGPFSIPGDLPLDSYASYNPNKSFASDSFSPESATIQSEPRSVTIPVREEAAEEAPPPASDPPPIQEDPHVTIQTRLTLAEVIGSGGYGIVNVAYQESLGRPVAVKRVRHRPEEGSGTGSSEQQWLVENSFKQEAFTLACLEHPNIVPVYDLAWDSAGHPVLVMKRIRGRSWYDTIKEDFAVLESDEFLSRHLPTLLDVANAVAFAHARGLIHRDIKPHQVVVGEFGETCLMDWGLAVAYDSMLLAQHTQSALAMMTPTLLTATNPAGTLAYMAPEQTDRSAENLGPWTDVFLLGGTLYHLLCGRAPYRGENSPAIFLAAHEVRFPPPEEVAPGRAIPAALRALVYEAMHPDPEQRIRSVQPFIEKLSRYLSGSLQREQAAQLVEQARTALRDSQVGYRSYATALVRLNEALRLAPASADAHALVQSTHEDFSRYAERNRDFTLARLQAEAIFDEAVRTGRLAEIDTAQRAADENCRQIPWRGIAFAAFALLGLMVALQITGAI